MGPIKVNGDYPDCDGSPVFHYEDHIGTVTFENCGVKLVEYPVDPGAFYDRPVEGGIDAFVQWVTATWRMASDGICFACAGLVDISFSKSAAGYEYSDCYQDFFVSDHPVLLELDWQNCSFYSYIPTDARLLNNPVVIRTLDANVIDVRNSRIWELPFIVDDDYVHVVDTDPWEVQIRVPTSDGTIEVLLDDGVSVAAVTERL